MKYLLILLTSIFTNTAQSFVAPPNLPFPKSNQPLSTTLLQRTTTATIVAAKTHPRHQGRPSSSKSKNNNISNINLHAASTPQPTSDSSPDESQRVEEPYLIESTPRIEAAWRYVKKPFLRIGDKGVAKSHANSLCELLLAHVAVKVKINTTKLGSWKDVFDTLKQSTEETGKIEGLEMIQYRPSENMLMVGRKGAMKMIENGEFPPPSLEE